MPTGVQPARIAGYRGDRSLHDGVAEVVALLRGAEGTRRLAEIDRTFLGWEPARDPSESTLRDCIAGVAAPA